MRQTDCRAAYASLCDGQQKRHERYGGDCGIAFAYIDQIRDARIDVYDKRLVQAAKADERAGKLMKVPGVGKLTAAAVLAAVADAHHFSNGRDWD